MNRTADVIIVGAGVIGCSAAFHLSRLGVRDLLILEKEAAAAQGSTARANGGIRGQWSTAVHIRFSQYSLEAFKRFEEATGGDCGLLQAGYLFLCAGAESEGALAANFALQQQLGVPNRWLNPGEIQGLAPYAACGDLRAGTFSPEDGFIDPHGTAHGYLRAALRAGARIRLETEVMEVLRDSSGAAGVRTAAGRTESRCIVNAAGPFAGVVARRAGTEIPVAPVRRMIACTEPVAGAPPVIPMTVDMDTGLLIRREGPGIILAYADPADPPGFDTGFDPAFIEVVSEKALIRFPFLEEAQITPRRCWAGLYPETPDHHAILGESPDLRGFFLAAGFGGHGVMHSPAAGLALAELITGGASRTLDIAPLKPERFLTGELNLERTVL